MKTSRLKFDILSNGLRLTERANLALFGSIRGKHAKPPIRTRSGVSGGLDLRLSENIFVNAPIVETFAQESSLLLDWEGSFRIFKDGEFAGTAEPLPEPAFHVRHTNEGNEPMIRIAQMCSPDRLCYGMTGPGCSFWSRDDRCRYCSIGLNAPSDSSRKREEQFYEVIGASLADPDWPARHILIGGGTPVGRDMGAQLAARLCATVKRRWNLSIYVMIAAPLDNEDIDLLHEAGADEVGFNLEFWSDDAWEQYIPGKQHRIGKARYLSALEYAVKKFGPVNTRSIIIAGLEAAAHTVAGVETLAGIGVMPIISPFRPLVGTELELTRRFTLDQYIDLYEECRSITNRVDLPLGPTCICCQNNTLALPFGHVYRWYGTNSTPHGS